MRSPNQKTAILVALVFLLIAPSVLFGQYAINTVAGGGPNNLPELSASIGFPGSIAFDTAGNTYIADSESSHIFKVDTAGNLTVVAGNGTLGYSGDGGPAASAALNGPEGVFVDGSGNIFIADTDNCLIREVSGGNISTVAGNASIPQPCGYSGDGGPATSAQLFDPFGIFVDGAGNIFIADTDNCLVREVSGGNISTVAGNPNANPLPCGYSGDGSAATSAQLDEPFGVFVDGSGNIFIADSGNNLIRVVNPGNAPVTIAGITIAAGDIQFVAGASYDSQGGTACQLTGDGGAATSAFLCSPYGVFVDGSQNIFITDTNNFAVREVAASTVNVITTPAGTLGVEGYSPNGTPATSADLNYPSNVVVDGSGNIFIADTDNFVIREVTASNGQIQTTIGNNTLAYSGDGGSAVNAELSAPGSVAVDAAGNIYIADSGNSVIRAVNTGASAVTIAGVTIQPGDMQTIVGSYYQPLGDALCDDSGDGGPALSAQLCAPSSVFLDSAGNIFIADTQNNAIRVVNTGTQALTTWGVTIQPGDIATVAGNGTICSGSAAACGDGGAATSAALANPYGVFVDSAENIFIADTDDYVVREVVASSGIISTVAGNYAECTQAAAPSCGDGATATSAQLTFVFGVFVDLAENIYIADTFDNRIRVAASPSASQPVTIAGVTISPGNIATVAGNGTRGFGGDGATATAANLDTPFGVFTDLSGDIFIADTENAAIREVVAATGFIQTVAGTPLTPGFSGDGGPATSAELNAPLAVFGTPAGDLFVADTDNARIRSLVSAIFVTVTPNPVNVVIGTQQQFTATVTGAGSTAVTWQVNGMAGGDSTVGTISTDGIYLAPMTVPNPAVVTITAILVADGTTSGSAQATVVTANDNITVAVSDGGATQVYTTTTQQFTATVTGTSNQAVNWYVEGSEGGNATYGTIDGTGLYTGPAAVPTPATITITAFSQAASNAFGTATITIVAAPSAADPAPQTVSPGGSANYSLVLNANTGAAGQTLTLSCSQSTLPAGATCSFTPTTVTPGPQAVPFALTITVPTGAASLSQPKTMRLALYCALLPLAGIVFAGAGLRNKRRRLLYLPGLIIFLTLLNACGGASSSTTPTGPQSQTYNVKVQGTTATQPNPVTIAIAGLTVQ